LDRITILIGLYLAVASLVSVPPGFLSEDCVMRVELFSGDDSLAVLEIIPAVGGEWAGMHLEGGVQYRVVAYHSQCTGPTPEGNVFILAAYAKPASAGCIIAFHLHHDGFQPGETGLICSFGAGYSAGTVFVRKRS